MSVFHGRRGVAAPLELVRKHMAPACYHRSMAVREILQVGNPLLRAKCVSVAPNAGLDTASTICDLSDTLAAFRARHGAGRGIAAPQIGVLQRIVYVRMHPTGFEGALLNPTIARTSADMMDVWDDCFSFPGVMVQVRRFVSVRVDYLDVSGASRTLEADDDLSELLQHELDHLDGVLMFDRAAGPNAFSTRVEWERRYRSPRPT